MNSLLKYHNLKDPWAETCEHCQMAHTQINHIPGLGEFKGHVMCDRCCEAEGDLQKIKKTIDKTNRLLVETRPTPANAELREKLEDLIEEQTNKKEKLLARTREFFEGQNQLQESGTNSRLPYKED